MFIAHGPCGYILSVAAVRRLGAAPISAPICAGVVGAIVPDIDLFYFYLIDGGSTHHHRYFTHWPVLWVAIVFAGAIAFRVWKRSALASMTLLFGLGGFTHMILDSFAGDIWWFAPFVDRPFSLVVVPARYEPWWLNFLLHWSFALELVICACALRLWHNRRAAA
jgi:membrane-bound metal-dependent hydrolase YbcI (DUF457 family)